MPIFRPSEWQRQVLSHQAAAATAAPKSPTFDGALRVVWVRPLANMP